jgi:Leucine-rich repeat (LRR) protein
MKSLKKLYLNSQTGAKITTLQGSWGGMTALQELYIHENNIVTLPAGWSGMTSLVTLHAHKNLILSPLPPEWSNMGQLVTM